MRTIEKNIYTFDELSESAKDKAVDKLRDINVDYDWWDFVYMETTDLGFKITEFDVDRYKHCKIKLIDSVFDICTRIMQEHGETCDTYKTAQNWLNQYNQMFKKYEDTNKRGYVNEELTYEFDNELEELEHEFINNIQECYANILQNTYDDLMSDELVIETILSNGYEFDEYGNMQ